MRFSYPTPKRLFQTWLTLMALTVASMAGGGALAEGDAPLGVVWVSAVLAITLIKAQGVLRVYLNLRASTSAWRAVFVSFLSLIGLMILLPYAIVAL